LLRVTEKKKKILVIVVVVEERGATWREEGYLQADVSRLQVGRGREGLLLLHVLICSILRRTVR
jgi:hypothetical protein